MNSPPPSTMALFRTRVRRLLHSRLGRIFSILIGLACVLFLTNYFGPSVALLVQSDNSVHRSNKLEALDSSNLKEWMPADTNEGNKIGRWKKKIQKNRDGFEQVCQAPKLTLVNDANAHAFYKMAPLQCNQPELFHLGHKKNVLRINQTTLGIRKVKQCEYRGIERMTDNSVQYTVSLVRTGSFELIVQQDFFRVDCHLDKYKPTTRRLLQAVEIEENPKSIFAPSNVDSTSQIRKKLARDEEQATEEQLVQENSPSMFGSMGLPDPQIPRLPTTKHAQVSKSKVVLDNTNAQEQNLQLTKNTDKAIKVNPQRYKPADAVDLAAQDGPNAPIEHNADYNMLQKEPDFSQFVAQIFPRDEVIQRSNEQQGKYVDSTQMNVLIFALDSMSHLSYQRKLPKTYDYIQNALKAVILNGYNIVGDATTAAVIPILTGKTEMEHPDVRQGKPGSTYVDAYPLIWNKFEQRGYVTLFAEDQPSKGVFQLRLNGFEEQPVDHYMRPFWLAVDESTSNHASTPQYCLGGTPAHQYTIDYILDFFRKYQDQPKFAFGFLSELSLADNNPSQYIDQDLVAMFESLRNSGDLDNTLVIVMADHGARYSIVRNTVQGQLEERLPMMSLAFPDKFKQKYPALIKNLEKNADRLTTPFDIHETLQSVLNIKKAHSPLHHADRGLCLLQPVPLNRTCRSAGIPLHWCSCLKYVSLMTSEPRVKEVGQYVLHHINDQTLDARSQCQPLDIKQLVNASIVIPNDQVLPDLESVDPDHRIAYFIENTNTDIITFQVTVLTVPNYALYEATVQVSTRTDEFSIVGEVSRITKYGKQPECIMKSHAHLQKYCMCRTSATDNTKRTGS